VKRAVGNSRNGGLPRKRAGVSKNEEKCDELESSLLICSKNTSPHQPILKSWRRGRMESKA
jgi:hypothetical protein